LLLIVSAKISANNKEQILGITLNF
jgi:hypothetical protein